MPTRIIISGAVAHHPFGGAGNTWAFLQYVLGFRELGCEVIYVEEIDAASCWDSDWKPIAFSQCENASYFARFLERHGITGALLAKEGDDHVGLSRREVAELAVGADLFLNSSGRFHDWEILRLARRRAYLDMDPGFTQIWQGKYESNMNLAGHDVFFTVGLNIGRAICPFPTLGLDWQPTLPPVVLSQWETDAPAGDAYTTIADWRGYSPIEWDGEWYGQKSEEFAKLIGLPRTVSCALELCLAIHPDEPDLPRLIENGWRLSDPRVHAADTDSYRTFVHRSRGELTAVKNGYAKGRTGWVSDRTVCYLAAGRPAVVQDTTLTNHLPIGDGFLVFEGQEQARQALERVEADYEHHATAARQIAREHFCSKRVLTRLLERAGV